ncbi:DVU3141 family protein [Roseomonas sp. HF4]|uniref:DVU3141 family protein n=1 Tax=Roseomonas sp. HF4 TaxID=2562313 RepID=UPI0010C0D803|nr:DVU3141 family protein [Roseomonas sp. HF4]
MNRFPYRSWRGWGGATVAALVLVGCAETGGPAADATDAVAAPISDPVVAFAAAASPGAEDSVVLAGTGQTASVRLVRAYAAASGRECREVQVRTGGGTETRLLCRAGAGWREARPLVRSAAHSR